MIANAHAVLVNLTACTEQCRCRYVLINSTSMIPIPWKPDQSAGTNPTQKGYENCYNLDCLHMWPLTCSIYGDTPVLPVTVGE